LFRREINVNIVIKILSDYARKYNVIIHAYCIMPDHLHILIEPTTNYPITRYIDIIKGRITHELHNNGLDGRIWQSGYYDHVLRKHENLKHLIKYILENPMRKGIVSNFVEYRWSWDKYGIKETALKQIKRVK